MSKKVVFESFTICQDCPYFQFQSEQDPDSDLVESWYQCGLTDRILISEKEATKRSYNETPGEIFDIPSWCPLEDYDLFHKAIDIVKNSENA